jgi:hypothetical protein
MMDGLAMQGDRDDEVGMSGRGRSHGHRIEHAAVGGSVRLSWGCEAVAHAGFGVEVAGVGRVGFEFAADVGEVDA